MNISELFNNNKPDVPITDKKERQRIELEQLRKQQIHNAIKQDLANQSVIDAKTAHKYADYGLTYNAKAHQNGSLDAQLADAQSNWAKAFNALSQTVVSEIGLGTLIGFSDLFDIVINAAMSGDNDYTNPITNKLVEWQETFRNEIAPIYSKPGSGFSNGTDFGWWMQNIPSIASSLTLLIPSTAATKVISLGGKLARNTGKALKGTRNARKWGRAVDEAEGVAKVNKLALSPATRETLVQGAKMFNTAVVSRTLENYQESRQVYNDMYEDVKESIDKMTDSEYANFLERNANTLAGVDVNNKDAVAKRVAKVSADTTFKTDYANLIFDVIQLYALRNMTFRGFKDSKVDRAARKLDRNAKKYHGQYNSVDELKEIIKKQSFRTKAAEFTKDALYDGLTIGFAQATEGMEEAINYIASQEGMHVGHTMLGMATTGPFNNRIIQYMKAPELWESAFWGVAGGITFQQVASGIGKARMAHNAKQARKEAEAKANSKTGEDDKAKSSWREDWETPDYKRVKTSIENRIATEQLYKDMIAKIEDGKNPFAKDADIATDIERELLKQKALEFRRAKLVLDAMDKGTMGILKSYLEDENVRNAMIEQGILTKNNAIKFQSEDIAAIEKLEEKYNAHAIALNKAAKNIERSEGLQIPLDYLQIMARNNMEHELVLEDYESTKRATEATISELERGINIENFAQDALIYRNVLALTWGTRRLGELQAEKTKLEKNKNSNNTVFTLERINEINNEMKVVRDMIYNLNEANATTNLLFAVQNSFKAVMHDDGNVTFDNINGNKDLNKALTDKDSKYFENIDSRLANIDFDNINNSLSLLNEKFTAVNDTKHETALDNISKSLKDEYIKLAAINYHIGATKKQLVTTDEQIKQEANNIHNVLNEVRRAKIMEATSTILSYGSKDKLGSDDMRDILRQAYEGKVLDFADLTLTEEDKTKIKDAIDTINLGSNINKNLYRNIDNQLAMLPHFEASDINRNDEQEDEKQGDIEPIVQQSNDNKEKEKSTQQEGKNEPSKYKNNETQGLINKVLNTPHNTTITYNELEGTVTTNLDDERILTINVSKTSGSWLNNSDLFTHQKGVSIVDGNYSGAPVEIVIDANGNIIEKGSIEIDNGAGGATAPQPSNSSTGEPVPDTSDPYDAPLPDHLVNDDTSYLATSPSSEEIEESVTINTEVHTLLINKIRKKFGDVPSSELINTIKSRIDELPTLAEEAANEIKQDGITINDKHITPDDNTIETLKNSVISAYTMLAGNTTTIVPKRSRATGENVEGTVEVGADIVSDAASVIMYSAFLENSKENEDAVNAFKDALLKFTNTINVITVNDKKYVNIEGLCKYIGHILNDPSLASMIANNVIKIATDSKEIVVTDESIDDIKSNIVSNKVYTPQSDFFTNININGTNVDNRKTINEILDNMVIGDTLTHRVTKTGIEFYANHNGSKELIGVLPTLKITDNGTMYQYNDGWRTDINIGTSEFSSTLMDLFTGWIINGKNNNSVKELNDIILEYAYSTDRNRKEQLIDAFTNNKNIVQAVNSGIYTVENPDYEQLLNGVAKLWKFVNAKEIYDEDYREGFRVSIEQWFSDKVLPSFKMLEQLQSSSNLDIEVVNITEGSLLKTKDYRPISEAIAPLHKNTVRVGVCKQPGIITFAGDGINGCPSMSMYTAKYGNSFVVIPARNGAHGIALCYGNKANATKNTPINNILTGIKSEISTLSRLLIDPKNTKIKQNVHNALIDLLKKLYPVSEGKTLNYNSALLKSGDTNKIIRISNNTIKGRFTGITLTIWDKDKESYTNYNFNSGAIYKTVTINKQTSKQQVVLEDNTIVGEGYTPIHIDKIIEELKEIIDNSAFNISFGMLESDKRDVLNLGFATRNDKGKFVITIPKHQMKNDGTTETLVTTNSEYEFDSYNDFLISNDMILTNIAPPYGETTNFNRNDKNFPQEVTVKISGVSSPVEASDNSSVTDTLNNTNTTTSKQDSIITHIRNNKDNINCKELVDLLLGKSYLENNPILTNLLPKSLIFIEDFIGVKQVNKDDSNKQTIIPINAFTNTSDEVKPFEYVDENGKTHVIELAAKQISFGANLLKLMNGTQTQQEEAVRKLIHEQLHLFMHSLNDDAFSEIQVVYNQAKKALSDTDMKKYFIYPDGRKAYEEFVVESLTSIELADALNKIKPDKKLSDEDEQSLYDTLIDIILKLLGIVVNQDNLYYQQLKAISRLGNSNVKKTDTNTDNTDTTDTDITNTQPKSKPDAADIHNNMLNNIYGSSESGIDFSAITESDPTTHSSVEAYLSQFKDDTYDMVRTLIDNGQIEIKCKLN